MLVLAFPFFPSYSVWAPSLCDGVAHVQVSLPLPALANCLQKFPHRHIQKCSLLISYLFFLSNPTKSTIKINHHWVFNLQRLSTKYHLLLISTMLLVLLGYSVSTRRYTLEVTIIIH
jgi:hypothetical protein